MNLAFAWPWLLSALPLPLVAARLLPRAPAHPPATLRVPFLALLQGSAVTARESAPSRWRVLIAALAWLALVGAAARPQLVGETLQLPVSSRSLMLAVDISGSMASEDMTLGNTQVSRLTAVKAVAGEFLEKRVGDRLGLILFGRQAYLQAPLTLDRDTVTTLLNEAQVGLAGKETAIGDAIGLGIKRLREQPAQNRILILLTDGANTAGRVDPPKAADLAAQEGVRIYTIGIGGDSTLLQTPFGVQRIATGDLDEDTLKSIAAKTGGRYFRARDSAALQEIYDLLDSIEPLSSDALNYRPVSELYAWPLAAALGLSVLIALPSLPLRWRRARAALQTVPRHA